jgi:hypothetical protein
MVGSTQSLNNPIFLFRARALGSLFNSCANSGMVGSTQFWMNAFVPDQREYFVVGSNRPLSETSIIKTGMESSGPTPQTKHTSVEWLRLQLQRPGRLRGWTW